MPSSESEENLQARMKRLGIHEDDLVEKFIRGSGSGGQKINKTSSCVFLQHPPSGIELKVQQDRSREANRILARQELCRQLEKRAESLALSRRQKREKIRRQKRRPGVRARARNVERKRRHSSKKQNRRRPNRDD